MKYSIVGFGKIGKALARAFARKNIEVTVASRRPPEALAPEARAIGPTVVAKSLRDALEADTIILAVPFGEHRDIAKALPSWKGKTVIDAMNSFPIPPEELDGLPVSIGQMQGKGKTVRNDNKPLAHASDLIVKQNAKKRSTNWHFAHAVARVQEKIARRIDSFGSPSATLQEIENWPSS